MLSGFALYIRKFKFNLHSSITERDLGSTDCPPLPLPKIVALGERSGIQEAYEQ